MGVCFQHTSTHTRTQVPDKTPAADVDRLDFVNWPYGALPLPTSPPVQAHFEARGLVGARGGEALCLAGTSGPQGLPARPARIAQQQARLVIFLILLRFNGVGDKGKGLTAPPPPPSPFVRPPQTNATAAHEPRRAHGP